MKKINRSKSKYVGIFAGIVLGLIFARGALAGSATLTWNANTEPDLAGYKVYYGTASHAGNCPAGFGSSVVSVGNVTTHTFNNLTGGQTYYFQITAVDTSNNESGCSSEVSKAIVASDTTAPVTTASPVGGTFTTAQSVTLAANESAIIYYTLDGSIPTTASTQYSGPIVMTATTTLKYFAKDAANNSETVKTQVYNITIAVVDAIAPSIPGNITAATVSSSQIALAWNASTDTNGVAGYKIYRHNVKVTTVTGTSYTDTGLVPSTVYKYRVAAFDASGNVSTQSNEVTAVTQAVPVSSGGGGGGGGGSLIVITPPYVTVTPAVAVTTTSTSSAVVTPIQPTTSPTGSVTGQYAQFGSYVTKKHLVYKAKGEDVKKLQEFLRVDGYLKEASTGYYGKATLAAVQAFQREHNIAGPGKEGYGEVGVKTRTVLNQHLIQAAGAPASEAAFQETLRKQIAILQAKVLELLKQLEEMKKKQ